MLAHENWSRTVWTGYLGQDCWDRTVGTGQLDRAAREDVRDNTARIGKVGQGRNLIARTGQLGPYDNYH